MAKRILIGLGILGLGVLALLSNIEVFNFSISFWSYWPIFLVLYGLGNIVDEKRLSLTSLIILVLGTYLLAASLGYTHISLWKVIVPALFILIGLSMIFGTKTRNVSKVVNENSFQSTSVFSDKTEKLESDSFTGASATVVFGGSTLDLSNVKTKGKSATINLTVAFGEIVIKVPDDWNVNSDGLICVFGGMEDSRKRKEEGKFTVYLTGCVAFGGVEIK